MFVHEEHPDADETLLFLHGGNVAGWTWYDLACAGTDRAMAPAAAGLSLR